MPGQPHFEVMSAQATTRLNGAPRGSAAQAADYGTNVVPQNDDPRRVLTEEPAAEAPIELGGPAVISDVGGETVEPGSSSQLGSSAMAESVGVLQNGVQSSTEVRDPQLQGSLQSSAQRTELTAELAGAGQGGEMPTAGALAADVEVNHGFFTPRSRTSQYPVPTPGVGRSAWSTWMARLGEMFSQPSAPVWMPSPIPSPPRPPTQLLRRTLDMNDEVEEGQGVFRVAHRPNHTPSSSSVPAEAIQAEVQRQLGSLLDRLSIAEAENVRLQEALKDERRSRGLEAVAPAGNPPPRQALPRVSPQVLSERGRNSFVPEGDPAPLTARASPPDPWSVIWEGLAGKFGSRAKAGAARPPTPPPASSEIPVHTETIPVGGPSGGDPKNVLETLAQGMQQLQDLQLQAMKRTNLVDETPEVVKTATVTLPELQPPLTETSGLQLQDWLVQVTTLMQDLSSGSGDWWEQVREKVAETYATWLSATPLERLQVSPGDYDRLASGKWTRVNARACALMMQSFSEVVKADLIARRSTQSAVMVLFRLYTTYQPGGAAERAVVLKHLQSAEVPTDAAACVSALRSWPRWLQRCRDMNMTVPDGSILARSLTATASKYLADNPDAVFRTQLVRSTYRIDAQPKIEDVVRYQQHLQAEVENILLSKSSSGGTTPSLRTLTPVPMGSPSTSSGARPCKFFLRSTGCRRGSKCPFQHSMDSLSKADKAKKCLSCGSEEHRAKDCPSRTGKGPPTKNGGDASQGTSPTSPTKPTVNKAVVEPEGENSPTRSEGEVVLQGQPVLTWEALLTAAAKVAGAAPATEPKAPSMRVLSIHGPASSDGGVDGAYALVDSGATHPLRRATNDREWEEASKVIVHLAGGEVVELKMNAAGTLLVPATGSLKAASSTPIVPLGSLVGVLGYRMEWRGSRCRLIGRDGEIITLKVREGCPEITEAQALDLIARIEEKKLANLQNATAVTQGTIRESVIAMNKTWFDHLISYCRSGIGTEALRALHNAPFLQELPPEAYSGLSEAAPISNGWDAMKGLKHLNRRTRKRFWSSRNWVVHLYAGKKVNEQVMFLERQGFDVLELDVERGRSQDVNDPLVWRALEWAARSGRISSIIGGPPQNTFMLRRHMTPGPEPLRSEDYPYGGWSGQSDKDKIRVNNHTGLFVKMIYLHALSTAGRCVYPNEPNEVKEVGFMLEQPSDPRSYMLFSQDLAKDSVSFWRTSLWTQYAEEAGLSSYSFDMSSLGKALVRHTTIGTNLPLRQLHGLRGRVQSDPYPPIRSPPSVWTSEFSELVAIAVREQRVYPRMLKMSAEQWRDHVKRGHLPFRSDCLTCVTAGATGRRHARVEHPSCFVLSADVSGPLKIPGLDADARGAFPKPHKYLFVAKLKIPKTFIDDGRGVGLEYDSGELEEAVLPDENAFDFEDPRPESEQPEALAPVIQEETADQLDEDSDEPPKERLNPEEDLDLTGPETTNLIFATAMPDNKGSTVLEAIQDVVMYCWALNIPIVRFHCDRGMEFYAKATRQWIKYHGMRFTTSEGGLHQQNGMVENAVRYVKQRARTLLIGAKLPQRLWPQAVVMAATAQRATVLGMESRLAAPFGTKVLVRRREYGGTAEPGKPDDLAPRWLEGRYLGLSETVRKGHLVYLSNDEGEKFVHTVHVRLGLKDPSLPEEGLEADLPGPPSRRLREKARGSGDVVAVSKIDVVGGGDLKERAMKLLHDWSQEEAEKLITHVSLSLDPGDRIFGVFRHGGRVGLTKVTYDQPWVAELFVRALKEKCPEAEFSAIYLSVNTSREIHVDSNNLIGMPNFLYPIVMPRTGGDLWLELRDGDVVKGKIVDMVDQKGIPRFGCVQPLTSGQVFTFNPHRRHAVLPWKGLRIVLVGYTPGVPQNIKGPEREVLSKLGFPIPAEVYDSLPYVAVRALSVLKDEKSLLIQEEGDCGTLSWDRAVAISDGSVILENAPVIKDQVVPEEDPSVLLETEELEDWDMYLPLFEGDPSEVPKALIASCCGIPRLEKAEVTFTKNIEGLLESLTGPLTVVHNVDPVEAAAAFSKWVAPVKKELVSFETASRKVSSTDVKVIDDIKKGNARIVPMKLVYTVKPPADEKIKEGDFFRRKARIVACGNLIADSGEETYAGAAPAEVVRSSLSISSLNGWEAAVIDVTAAFLQTPLSEVQCKQRILGQPPRVLVRGGLCEETELWEYTHAIYGLRESPRWWGEYRDSRLAQLNVVLGDRKIKLLQCRVESSWWRLVEDAVLVGIVVVYVDDLLICSTPSIVVAVSKAIQRLWETSALSWASNGIRFLGIEISKVGDGFSLSQEPYIRELLRIHEISPTQRDLIPVARDQARFEAEEEEAVFTVQELRRAQQLAGEVLWLSQRTRPDVAYTASLVSSLCARAPRRAASIARKCLGYLQRTMEYQLRVHASSRQIIAWTDASFAPEGARSHSGWIIQLGDTPISWRSSRQTTVTLSTAESELAASVEGALALVSTEALLRELQIGDWESVLRTDSTSSESIQRGSGSWRTRHLRIKSSWIGEKLESGELRLEHWPGESQRADALTKALSSHRLRDLCRLIGLMPVNEFPELVQGSYTSGSSIATTPNAQGLRVIVAMILLSQAVATGDSTGLTLYEPMTVDHGLVAWCVFAVLVLLWTLAWEFLKYAGWQIYFTAVPGASTRRLRRLQRIRDTTAEAIRNELESRRYQVEEQRATQVRRPTVPTGGSGSSSDARSSSTSVIRSSEGQQRAKRTVYRADQRDKGVQTTGPVFAPVAPEVRTEVRIPGHVHVVPGNQCFHVHNPCYAFRHRGTQERVQTLRICEYCVRHNGRDPNDRGGTFDEILRAGMMPNFDRPGVNPG